MMRLLRSKKGEMTAQARTVIMRTIELEGGEANRPASHDPGGYTNFGITWTAFSRTTRRELSDLRNMTLEEAIGWYHTYLYEYHLLDSLPMNIAGPMFDALVHHGSFNATRFAQLTVNQLSDRNIAVDGMLGPITRSALIVLADSPMLVPMLTSIRLGYLSGRSHFRHNPGWVTRIKTIRTLYSS